MWNQNYYISFLQHFIIKKIFSVRLIWLEIRNAVDLIVTFLASSTCIIIHFLFINVQGRDFRINFAGKLCLKFYISCIQGPNLCLGKRNSFFLRKTISLFAVKPNIIALHSADLKRFSSDTRKKGKFNL